MSPAPNDATAPAPTGELEYVGFWPRLLASLVDTLWVTVIVTVVGALYERVTGTSLTDQLLTDPAHISVAALESSLVPSASDLVIQLLLPALLIVVFWFARNTTPGKMLLNARIVDADTGAPPSRRQLLIRYLGYYVSLLPLGLGFFWVGIDPRKQGWHDKLARTVVVRPRVSSTFSVPGPAKKLP